MSTLVRQLEVLLSPPKNYAKLTYNQRLADYLWRILSLQKPFKIIPQLIILSSYTLLSYLLFPVAYALKKSGYRFVDIDLDQIGSILFLDTLLREDRLKYQTPKHKILVLASHFKDGNRYIMDLYTPHVIYVRHILVKAVLYPLFINPLFKNDSSHRYESVHFKEAISHNIWHQYRECFGSFPLISMPEKDKNYCKSLLKKHLPDNQPFVTLHVRDIGFYQIASQTTRNADVFTYEEAILFLIEKGFNVIRIGDPNMVNIEPLLKRCGPKLFDYAKSDIKSEMMDAYLLSECAFLAGGTSGPANAAPVFHTNTLATNWYGAATGPFFIEGDICTIKKLRYKHDDSLVPFSKLFYAPYCFNPSQKKLEEIGVYLEDNSADEILQTFQEYLGNEPATVTALQERAKAMIQNTNYARGAAGHFSNTILRLYEKSGRL